MATEVGAKASSAMVISGAGRSGDIISIRASAVARWPSAC